jgi:hypothetical protein
MNSYTTVNLLLNTVYGTPSGNYDGTSPDFYGNSTPAANYYAGQGNLQTLTYLLDGFTGMVTVQATLENDTPQAAWFDVDTYGDGVTPVTETHSATVIGNFAHLRAHITEFASGNVAVNAAY